MTRETLRVGLVGCGEVAWRSHIPALRSSDGTRVVAVCDSNESFAQAAARQLRTARWYSDFANMLDREQMDVVDICTPPSTHARFAAVAAKVGCHVLVEKPMAITVEECDEMLAAAATNHVSLGVVHNELFKPVVAAAMSIVRNGGVGNVTAVETHFSRKKDDDWIANQSHWCHRLPGGIFGDILPHAIYLVREFLGDLNVAAVQSLNVGGHDWMAADELSAILTGKHGLATVISSCNRSKETATLEVFGTEMNLHVDIYNAVLTRYGRWGSGLPSRAIENAGQAFSQVVCTLATAMKKGLGQYHAGDHICVRRFIESVRHGSSFPVTGEDGREVVRVLAEIASQIHTRGSG